MFLRCGGDFDLSRRDRAVAFRPVVSTQDFVTRRGNASDRNPGRFIGHSAGSSAARERGALEPLVQEGGRRPPGTWSEVCRRRGGCVDSSPTSRPQP